MRVDEVIVAWEAGAGNEWEEAQAFFRYNISKVRRSEMR
jgi:hypothetical protein